jgi:hypothetical protein
MKTFPPYLQQNSFMKLFHRSSLLAGLLLVAGTGYGHNEPIQYQYDSAGRLIKADYGHDRIIYYTYSRSGSLLARSSVDNTDSDGDGLPDAWETVHFGGLGRDGTGDFDNDGASDLDEFRAGTDPTSNASAFKLVQVVFAAGSQPQIQWKSVAGKKYRLQYKTDLSATGWTDLAGDVTANSVTSQKTDTTFTEPGKRFYRILLIP